jgi:hypothetical protein
MSGIYLTDLAHWLRGAGLAVVEYQGWQTRARSSGGYASLPLCVMWHHTASKTSPGNDANYMCSGSPDRPIANILIARDGSVWVLAAGATNTNGKGNALAFSRGNVPNDGMNTRALGCEIANNGVGEFYPEAQVNAMFTVSNVCNERFGNKPTDLATHNLWAPTRKIDPATATAVQGLWHPSSTTTSGTWSEPEPVPDLEDDDMALLTRYSDNTIWVVAEDFSWKFMVSQTTHDSIKATGRYKVCAIEAADLEQVPGK